jgi:outer membrane protein
MKNVDIRQESLCKCIIQGSTGSLIIAVLVGLVFLLSFGIPQAEGAEIVARLDAPPSEGALIFLLFDSANTFGDLRDPVKTLSFPASAETTYRMVDVPAGEYALVVFHDENGNSRLDKNFIGIPKEPMGFSNSYQPKGPPTYLRARFEVAADEIRTFDIEFVRPLGERGRLGVGPGVILRSSPYRGSDDIVAQPIPAITYNGERLQLFGTGLRFGLLGSGDLRLAATASYRIGAYEEDDSRILRGLGDRDDTMMAGLAVIWEIPYGIRLRAGYEHDVLDEIGGGSARISADKSSQYGIVRLTPEIALNWLSSELSNHDFGVPRNKATAERPAYRLDDTFSVETGVGTFVDLSRDWRIVFDVRVEFLEDEITDSPIVSDDYVIKGFAAISYVF